MNVFITGASKGIGLELTGKVLSAGHSVFAVARAPGPALTKLQKEFAGKLTVYKADLRNEKAIEKIADALENWPQLDLLINNAGIYPEAAKVEDFLECFHVNSIIPFLLSKALLPKLRKGHEPKLVQITSLMGSIADNGSGGSYAYRASKSALNMLNKCLAVENSWLTAVVIHPGWVQTDMGGKGAPLTVEISVNGIWRVTQALKPEDSGKFLDYTGKFLPW
jgi:NAD(P)-dependent dehydrogenase (short-subunit alcohol dehydrogenase family)